jgi:hypothetical protein
MKIQALLAFLCVSSAVALSDFAENRLREMQMKMHRSPSFNRAFGMRA